MGKEEEDSEPIYSISSAINTARSALEGVGEFERASGKKMNKVEPSQELIQSLRKRGLQSLLRID